MGSCKDVCYILYFKLNYSYFKFFFLERGKNLRYIMEIFSY